MICFINLVDGGLAKIEFIFLLSPFIVFNDLFICFLLFKFQFLSTLLSSYFPSSSLLILYSENRYFPGSPPLKNIVLNIVELLQVFDIKISLFCIYAHSVCSIEKINLQTISISCM